MGVTAGIGGLIGGLTGLFGGGSKQPTAPPGFTMPNMTGAANSAFGGIGNLQPFTDLGTSALGTGQNIFNTLQSNPFGNQFLGGAVTAGGLGQAQALGQYGQGNLLAGTSLGLSPYIGQILNTSMDPQGQLYNYLQNQNLQQAQAINQGAGLGTTPYGAGVEALANQQFNMNWQNQQLQRQLAGAQGAGGLLGSIGAGVGQGAALASAAPTQYLSSSGLPYNVFQGLGQTQLGNLSSLLGIGGQGQGLANQQIQDYLGYIQAGNQANQVANQLYGLQLQAQNQQFNQNMAFGSALGGGLFNIGKGLFGSGGSMFSPGGSSFFPSSSFLSHGFGWG